MSAAKERAIKRIGRAIRRYYFETLDENTLKLRSNGSIYHWDEKQENFPELTLLKAVEKLTQGVSRYVVGRTNPMDWKRAEKLFSGYNFPYKPGIGLLASAFPEGMIQIFGWVAVPAPDIIYTLKKFYLTLTDRAERKYHLDLIKRIEESKAD